MHQCIARFFSSAPATCVTDVAPSAAEAPPEVAHLEPSFAKEREMKENKGTHG